MLADEHVDLLVGERAAGALREAGIDVPRHAVGDATRRSAASSAIARYTGIGERDGGAALVRRRRGTPAQLSR